MDVFQKLPLCFAFALVCFCVRRRNGKRRGHTGVAGNAHSTALCQTTPHPPTTASYRQPNATPSCHPPAPSTALLGVQRLLLWGCGWCRRWCQGSVQASALLSEPREVSGRPPADDADSSVLAPFVSGEGWSRFVGVMRIALLVRAFGRCLGLIMAHVGSVAVVSAGLAATFGRRVLLSLGWGCWLLFCSSLLWEGDGVL